MGGCWKPRGPPKVGVPVWHGPNKQKLRTKALCLSHKTYSPKDEPMSQPANYIKYDLMSFVYLDKLHINPYKRFELEVLRLLEIMYHCSL